MASIKNYETSSEAINDLNKRGYTSDFNLKADDNCIFCAQSKIQINHDDFEIDEFYRFYGASDPADEVAVYAISSEKYNLKGVLVDSYGAYASKGVTEIIKKLDFHKS